MGVPVEVIVNRVVDSAAIFAAKTDVERSDANVLEERREVRAGAEGPQMQISALPDFLFLICWRFFDGTQLLAFPCGEFRLGILNVFCDIVHEFFKRVGTTETQITP